MLTSGHQRPYVSGCVGGEANLEKLWDTARQVEEWRAGLTQPLHGAAGPPAGWDKSFIPHQLYADLRNICYGRQSAGGLLARRGARNPYQSFVISYL